MKNTSPSKDAIIRAGVVSRNLLAGTAIAALLVSPAIAQTSAAAASEDIVVTGTLIKGIDKPVGANVIGLSEEDIVATGVSSGQDLLVRMPLIAGFNQLPAPGTATGQLPFTPPSIRGLGGLSGMSTLVLIDGHRVVTQGIGQTWVDASMIPAGHLARVEVVPDGGSSIYGSDAIGGVINYITKRRIDGAEFSARYGVADAYASKDANAAFGRAWDTGNLGVSFSYSDHDAVFGKDRDYIQSDWRSLGGQDFRVQTCNPGNVAVGAVNYPLPGTTPGTANFCSNAQETSFYPDETKWSVFGTWSQNLSDKVTFDLSTYYANRETTNYAGTNSNATGVVGTGTITNVNPYFVSRAGESQQTVSFNYSPVFGSVRAAPSEYQSYGATPTLTFKLSDTWDLRFGANYGESTSEIFTYGINNAAQTAALRGTTIATALNPYNIAVTNAAVLALINDDLEYAYSKQKLAEEKIQISGDLFDLPGGPIRVAAGVEARSETLATLRSTGLASSPQTSRAVSREVKSVFGEALFPLVGANNAAPGVESLELSLSARYDEYDDVGNSTNPKVGFTYVPFHALTLRGQWGTSFHAPALPDSTIPLTYSVSPNSAFRAAGSSQADFGRPTIQIIASDPNIRPETATTWSVGGDLDVAQGLVASLTYWNVDYQDRIDFNAGFFGGAPYFADPLNQGFFILNPTLAQILALGGGDPGIVTGAPSLASLYAPGAPAPYVVISAIRQNLGQLRTDGLDFSLRYNGDVGPGRLTASLAGTYYLKRETRTLSTGIFVDNLANGTSPLLMTGTLGYRTGPFNIQTTVNYTDEIPVLNDPVSRNVNAYTVTNIFGSYDLPGSGLLADSSLTLNVDNIFDVDPPFRANANGVQFRTLGRLVTVGLRKKF